MVTENMEDLPERAINQTLVEYTESLTDGYLDRTPLQYLKKRGQYFTPRRISEFMVRQFEDINKKREIKILDPGAGMGIFESAFCEYIKSLNKNVKISFDLYENDANILPLLRLNTEVCRNDMTTEGFRFSYKILNEDFILSNASIFDNPKENYDTNQERYDLVISNPPYYKLKKDSPQIIKMKNIINGQPNIYPLFMALSARLLKNGGQMTILTPRSYCSGLYFKKFRNWFFETVKPYKIHLFESRKEVFKKYGVLQENVILTAIKTSRAPKNVLISVSDGIPNEKLKIKSVAYDKIIVKKRDDVMMRILVSESDDLIATYIDKFDGSLETFGFKVSTGPVVPFRAKDLLLRKIYCRSDSVPLIWMQNILNGMIKWPIEKNNKPIGIKKTKKSRKILIPNKNYVLIKRFSTKEGKQRINAGIYLNDLFSADLIGIENHVNYISKIDGELTINEVYGIVALLNSRLYNRYFQITNGSTQVNANEISGIPVPPLEIIREMGNSIRKLKRTDDTVKEKVVTRALKIDKKIENELIVKKSEV